MGRLKPRLLRLLSALGTIVVVVGSFWGALNGGSALALGLSATLAYSVILGVIVGLNEGVDAGLARGIVGGLAVGLAVGFVGVFAPERLSSPGELLRPVDLVAVTLAMNFTQALVRSPGDLLWRPAWMQFVVTGARNGALMGSCLESCTRSS